MNRLLHWLSMALSENGVPSASRALSTWLSLSSMALIWWMVRHMMSQPVEKLQVWVGGLPMIIGSLAAFVVAPYGVNKAASLFKGSPPKANVKPDNPDSGE